MFSCLIPVIEISSYLDLFGSSSTFIFILDALHGVIASHDNSANKIETITGIVKRETHDGEISAKHKILTCPICRKKFKKALNLKSHILLHKGRLKFKRGVDELMNHKKSHYQEAISGMSISIQHFFTFSCSDQRL